MVSLGTTLGQQAQKTSDLQYQFGETDSITFPQNRVENISLDFANIFTDRLDNIGSVGVYGNPTYGVYGSAWYGPLGSDGLGSFATRVEEKQVLCDWFETFDDSTYKDTGSTTGSWSNTGSLTLGSAEEAWSTTYTDDVTLTDFINMKFIPYVSTGSILDLDVYMSVDNGSNWTSTPIDGTIISLGSSEYDKNVLWKVINTGSDIININTVSFRAEGENYIRG